MKVTKFVHSCLLVEHVGKVAIFDPGVMSEQALDVSKLTQLDDIFITHQHGDHKSMILIKQLVDKFPSVRITTTNEVVEQLAAEGIKSSATPPETATLFTAPHENVAPVFPQPENTGFHFMGLLSDPGDSHSFNETKQVLALPVTAPWGGFIDAIAIGLKLKPKYILPIHDWHWSDMARQASYSDAERIFGEQGITFFKLETGVPVEIPV